MTENQLKKKVSKLFHEVNELLNNESYMKSFAESEVDGHLLNAKWELDLAYDTLFRVRDDN